MSEFLKSIKKEEQDLMIMLDNRKRIVDNLIHLDKKIEKQKALLIHKFKNNAENLKIGNIYKLDYVALKEPIEIGVIEESLKAKDLVNKVVVLIDYEATLKNLEKKGIIGVKADSIVEHLKSLQEKFYDELKLKGGQF